MTNLVIKVSDTLWLPPTLRPTGHTSNSNVLNFGNMKFEEIVLEVKHLEFKRHQ